MLLTQFKRSLYIILAVIFIISCSKNQPTSSDNNLEKLGYADKKTEVTAQVIARKTFFKEIVSNGKLVSYKKAKLVFKVNETISAVPVNNGQWVKQGNILVKLTDYNQQLILEKAKTQLLKSEIELKDLLLAHNQGNNNDLSVVNPQVLETARGRSGYNDAIIALKEAEFNLQHTIIKAPFDGLLSDIQVKENNYSGNYEYFAQLQDNRQMELEFGIMETELAMVSINALVIVKPLAFPNKMFNGKVTEINPTVNETGMINIKAIIPNPNGELLDGMHVEVVVRKEITNQLIIPKQAVLLRQQRQVVFTLKNDSIAQWVYVKTFYENSSYYSISEGLNSGDTVIVSNNFNLGHDVVVRAEILKE